MFWTNLKPSSDAYIFSYIVYAILDDALDKKNVCDIFNKK